MSSFSGKTYQNNTSIQQERGASFLMKSEIHFIHGIKDLNLNCVLLQAYMPSFSSKTNQSVSIKMKEK